MIQANELRIGNWIYVPVKDSMQDGTWKDGVNQVEVTSIDEFGELGTTAYFHMSMGCTGTTCKDAIPIELSPEILTEWCGFKRKADAEGYCFELNIFFKVEWLPSEDHILFFRTATGSHAPCKYLHQFQNLYFALMGEELEIKIPVKA